MLFNNAQDCQVAAKKLQGEKIGKRWIELFVVKYQEYLDFDN